MSMYKSVFYLKAETSNIANAPAASCPGRSWTKLAEAGLFVGRLGLCLGFFFAFGVYFLLLFFFIWHT